jgi:hypothetical protein
MPIVASLMIYYQWVCLEHLFPLPFCIYATLSTILFIYMHMPFLKIFNLRGLGNFGLQTGSTGTSTGPVGLWTGAPDQVPQYLGIYTNAYQNNSQEHLGLDPVWGPVQTGHPGMGPGSTGLHTGCWTG